MPWESFNIRQKPGLFVFSGHSHIESSHSLRQIDTSGWAVLALWSYQDLTHEISIFVKILFNFKKKDISLNKGKPENSFIFNITKNQEFELITSCHFTNPISPKPTWNSQWSLISSRNLKWWHHCPYLRDCWQITFVTLNRFCLLSNPPSPPPRPPRHPFFDGQYHDG